MGVLMEVRWGFIGVGEVTRVKASPAGAFTQEGSRVVAATCSNVERARTYARTYGIPRVHSSAEDLCADREVNAVYVCTPHHLHADHVFMAIRAGKHVLCEKPMAASTAECVNMAEAADRAGVILAIAYYRRLYPVVARLKEIIESGRLGTLTTAQIVKHDYFVPRRETLVSDRRSQWRTALKQSGGGTLNEAGSHRIDLLLYLFGEAESVSGELDRFAAWYEGEDQASVTIRFRNRLIAQTDHSWCNRSPRDFFAVAGTSGQAIIENLEESRLLLHLGSALEVIEAAPRPSATHRALVADFCQTLQKGTPLRCSGWDGLRSTQLIQLAYQAARERRTVDVPCGRAKFQP
jgi:predicted dehydrogenase